MEDPGQEPLERHGVAIILTQSCDCAVSLQVKLEPPWLAMFRAVIYLSNSIIVDTAWMYGVRGTVRLIP